MTEKQQKELEAWRERNRAQLGADEIATVDAIRRGGQTTAQPEPDMPKVDPALQAKREALMNAIEGAHDEIAARKEQAWEAGDEERGVVADPQWVAKLQQRQAELAEFDAVYPEVLAAIKEEKKRRTAENQWR